MTTDVTAQDTKIQRTRPGLLHGFLFCSSSNVASARQPRSAAFGHPFEPVLASYGMPASCGALRGTQARPVE